MNDSKADVMRTFIAEESRTNSAEVYTHMMTDPKSPSPVCFWGLCDSFLGVTLYTTRLSFTSTPIFGAAATSDFSSFSLVYLTLAARSL